MGKKKESLLQRFLDSDFYLENSNEIAMGILVCSIITYVFCLIFVLIIVSEILEKFFHL